MKLVPVPPANGRPVLWVNPDHLTSVGRLDFDTGNSVQLRAELKVEGMPLQRVDVGTFPTIEMADAAWASFLAAIGG
jgi:hypothetical protein